MKGSTPQNPDPQIDRADTEAADFATNQEGAVLPWFAGEQKMSLRWVSPVYGQFAAESGDKRQIYTTGIGAISVDSMGVAVIGIERLLSISLDSMGVAVAGQETLSQALSLYWMGVAVAGQDAIFQGPSLESMAVSVAGQETLLQSLSLDSFAVVIIGLETY